MLSAGGLDKTSLCGPAVGLASPVHPKHPTSLTAGWGMATHSIRGCTKNPHPALSLYQRMPEPLKISGRPPLLPRLKLSAQVMRTGVPMLSPLVSPLLLPVSLLPHEAVGAVGPHLLAGEAKAADARVRQPTAALTGDGDGVPDTAVRQPSPVTAIQLRKLPGRVELSHFGNGSPVVATCLPGLLEVQVAPDEVDLAWGWREDSAGEHPSCKQPQPCCKSGWAAGLGDIVRRTGDHSTTLKSRGKAESIKSVLLLVPGTIGPDTRQEEAATTRLPRVDDGVVDSPVKDPASVAPVQTLCPGCGARGGSAPALPSSPYPDRCDFGLKRKFFKCFTFVQLLVGGEAGVLLLTGLLGFVVVEFVASIAGLVREDNTWRDRDRVRAMLSPRKL